MPATTITADYVLPAGQEVSATDQDLAWVQGAAWTSLIIHGRFVVTAPTNGLVFAIRASTEGAGDARTLTIGAAGSVVASSTAPGLIAGVAAYERVNVVNRGLVDVRGANEASGVSLNGGRFENHGSVVILGPGGATGVSMSRGGAFLNTGTISVTGGSDRFEGATGVLLDYGIPGPGGTTEAVNSGSIIAATVNSLASSVGVGVSGWTTLVNSGLIQADYAIVYSRGGISSGGGRHLTVVNSGTLRGEVDLNNATSEPVILLNTGLIDGDVQLNHWADTYTGVGGSLVGALHGDAGADSLIGGSNADTLFGDDGNDTIDGGAAGSDQLDGGAGVDTLSFAGSATPVYLNFATLTNSRAIAFSNFERYLGSSLADEFLGSSGADAFNGADGGDTLSGLGGDDALEGGAGADQLFGGLGADTVTGGFGANFLRGEDGDDWIVGGAETDDAHGNMGNDTVEGGAGDDWVVGGKDNDRLYGQTGSDVVLGNLGTDTLEGGDGDDVVRGGQGDDSVNGQAGIDWVSGDRGSDTLTGGAGADNFHVFDGSGVDRVTDFNAAEGDRVWLLAGTQWSAAQVGADTVVTVTGAEGGQLVLVGVTLASLPAGWIFGP